MEVDGESKSGRNLFLDRLRSHESTTAVLFPCNVPYSAHLKQKRGPNKTGKSLKQVYAVTANVLGPRFDLKVAIRAKTSSENNMTFPTNELRVKMRAGKKAVLGPVFFKDFFTLFCSAQ